MEWFNHSRLFDLARQGKRLPHIVLVIPLSIIFIILSQFGALPYYLIMTSQYGLTADGSFALPALPAAQDGLIMGVELVSSFLLVYFILWAWVKLFEKRPFWTMGYEIKNAAYQYARGLIFGTLIFAGAVIILAGFGSVSFEQGAPARQGFAALGGVLLVLVGWIVQGGSEEILMRGWVLPVIGARYKPWIGLLVSSLIFSLLHGLNPGLSVIALVNLALFGVFTGLYAMREGSLWGVSALHSVWNWVQGNFFGFQVSGLDAKGGTLINLMETGADWFTGGPFGPEGGLAVTIVLAIGILITLFWKASSEAVG